MSEWVRIGDDDLASFGVRSMVFPLGQDTYVVKVDDADQDKISVIYDGATKVWHVLYKEVNNGIFRLSGPTGGRGDPRDDDPLGYWFELTLSTPARLIYWGDRVIIHNDEECV